jgi:hypothetical protein
MELDMVNPDLEERRRNAAQTTIDRRERLAREVDIAAGRRMLCEFLAWLESPSGGRQATIGAPVRDLARKFWKLRTGGEL